MDVEDLIEQHPRSVGYLMDRGVVCMKCGEPVWGTLGELIRAKGLDVGTTIADLEKFLLEGS
jgi:hypothetical protein